MNRERVAWTVCVMVIAILAFQLPGSLAHRDDDYAWVRTLIDIHRYVADSYVDKADEEKLRQGAIDGMLGELDPYSVYVPPARDEEFHQLLEGSFRGIGIELVQDPKTLQTEVVTPIEGSPAVNAGVMAGDIIQQVNGEDVAGMRLEEVREKIKGPIGTEVAMTVKHLVGGVQTLHITRQEIVIPTVRGLNRGDDNAWEWFISNDPKIAYVRITQFTEDTFKNLEPLLQGLCDKGMKGLVLDLRWNPGGQLDQAEKVVDLFVREGVIVTTRGEHRPEYVSRAKDEGTLPDFPMVVLVNEHSASASEIVAGSLKDNKRALVVGTRSFGKGSVQEVIPLDNGSGLLKLTVAYYYLPSGRLVHRKKDAKDWGVEPQIAVPMDDASQQAVFEQMQDASNFHRPRTPILATQTTTAPTTQPTSKPVDSQLEAAVSTLVGHIVLASHNQAEAGAATRPAR